MTSNPIIGVAVVTFLAAYQGNCPKCVLCTPVQVWLRPIVHVPLLGGTIVAKNKNQNRQREQQQERQRTGAMEAQEHAKSSAAEEQIMPSSQQVSRKHQRRFGHN
jgi:hypothetical protein